LFGSEAALGRLVVFDVLNDTKSNSCSQCTANEFVSSLHTQRKSGQAHLFKCVESIQHLLLHFFPLLPGPLICHVPFVRHELMRQNMKSTKQRVNARRMTRKLRGLEFKGAITLRPTLRHDTPRRFCRFHSTGTPADTAEDLTESVKTIDK
jgi:hypothetical protein